MRKTDLEGIRVVIRRVRADRVPALSESFLDSILEIEATTTDDDASAQRRIREAIEQVGGKT